MYPKLLEKFIQTAEENGWEVTVGQVMDTQAYAFVMTREERGDGYPYMLTGVIEGSTLEDGRIWNDYGRGPEEFKAGQRYQLDVLRNVNNPLRYKPFYDAFLATEPSQRSEKAMSELAGPSERQIRKARMCGFSDVFTIDVLCVRLLGVNPASVYGYSAYVAGVNMSENPVDIDEKV